MSEPSPAADKRRKKPRFRRTLIGFGVLVVVLGALVALLPTITAWQVRSWLERQGARAVTVEHLRINPATGEISFRLFRSIGPDGKELSVGPAHLRIDLADLAQRQVTVTALSIANADVHIRYETDGRWSIAGLPMEFGPPPKTPEPPSEDPWQLVAGDVGVDSSVVALTLGKTTYRATIDRLRIGTLSTLAPELPTPVELKGRTGGGTLTISGTAKPFLKVPDAALDVDARDIDLGIFRPMLTGGRVRDFAGKATLKGKLAVTSGEQGVAAGSYDGDLDLADGRADSVLFHAEAKSLAWHGKMDFDFGKDGAAGTRLPSVNVLGKASADSFKFVNRASRSSLSSKTAVFDMSKSGVSFKPGIDSQGSSRIAGNVAADLENAFFAQPESGLRVAASRIATVDTASVVLPAGTADLSGQVSGTLEASGLKGEMKTAGLDTLDATSLKLAYSDLSLALKADGSIKASAASDFDATGFVTSMPAASVKARAASISGAKTRLSFARSADGILDLTLDGPLQASQLRAQASDASWKTEQDGFSWSGRIDVGGNASGKSDWSVDGKLESRQVAFSMGAPSMAVKVAHSSWTGSAGATSQPGSLKVGGEAHMEGLKLSLDGSSPMIATLGGMHARNIGIAGPTIRIGNLSVSGFDARPADKSSDLPRATLRSLILEDVSDAGGARIRIGRLRGTGGTLVLTRGAGGKLVFPAGIGSKSGKAEKPADRRDADQAAPTTFALGNAVLADTRLRYFDKTIDPAFDLETSRFQLSVSDFDTAKPESNGKIEMLVGLDKYGRLDAKGTVKPDFKKISADLDIAFRNIELFKFNPYIQPVIKRTIRQGRADGDILVDLKKDRLNAKTNLTISRLQVRDLPGSGKRPAPMGPADQTDPNAGNAPVSQSSGPPIETAISLLQNDEGIIKLSIPISGSLEDPQFDLSNTIAKAVGNALKDTLMTAVKIAFPLGAVFAVVDSVGNSEIGIEPLIFPPGSAAITPELSARVDEVGRFLKKKTDEKPSVCGYATPADVKALEKTKQKLDANAAEATAIDLARKRMDAVRDRLVSKSRIAPQRLFTCAPEIDRKPGAKPRVRITL